VGETSDPIGTSLPIARDSELPVLATSPVAPATRKGRRLALAALLGLAFLAVAYLASPIWVGLVVGTVMAFTAQPLYRRLASRFHRKALAAIITTLTGGIVMAAGAAAGLFVLAREILIVVDIIQRKSQAASLAELIGPQGIRLIDSMHVSREATMAKLQEAAGQASAYAAKGAGVILTTTTSALITIVFAFWTMYYVLLEWPKMALHLERVLPLDPRHTRALMLEFREVGRSAFIGTLGTAVVQGVLAWIGFAIAGVPQPVTWGAVTMMASFIPVVGTAMVWVTAGLWLIWDGHLGWAIFVFAWGSLIVMAVADYVVRPRLVGGKGQGHPLLMLIALIGGIEVFGLAGLIAGPVVMSLFVAILRIYEREAAADALGLEVPMPKPEGDV
jgi:predicted PurR-regulated permease PerM